MGGYNKRHVTIEERGKQNQNLRITISQDTLAILLIYFLMVCLILFCSIRHNQKNNSSEQEMAINNKSKQEIEMWDRLHSKFSDMMAQIEKITQAINEMKKFTLVAFNTSASG